jgi:hypothetical protein
MNTYYNLPVDYRALSPLEKKAVRDQYTKVQGGLCRHCNSPLTEEPPESVMKKSLNSRLFPPNFLKHPVHLHHCHTTGLTKGAVHSKCNGVLWQYYGE